MEMEIGKACTVQTVVDESNIAGTIGSGLVAVFSTPSMIAEMEKAAATCMQQFLGEGLASVGAHVNVSHTAATPIGGKITTTATITAVERKRVDFKVISCDEKGEVGSGTHTRFVINLEQFLSKNS